MKTLSRAQSLRMVLRTIPVIAAVLLPTAAMPADEVEPQRHVTVAIDGKAILPSHGTVAGVWLFAESGDAQVVLLGHPPRRAVASLGKGHRMTIRASGDTLDAGSRQPVSPHGAGRE